MTPHKYKPFTTRDGSTACKDCYGIRDTEEHRIGEISDELLDAVENEVGMGAGAWDTINPKAIIAAVIKVTFDSKPKTKEPLR